jgi:hypothetical protein
MIRCTVTECEKQHKSDSDFGLFVIVVFKEITY